jgi:dienelactone hydrolase
VSFAAAYGNERVIAQVYLPRNAPTPYQTVVWFGGTDVEQLPSSDTPGTPFYFDFLVRGGRAVIVPVFQGTYERRAARRTAAGENARRDLSVARSKDLGRTLDYLQTRLDIDPSRLAFYGFSLGTTEGIRMVALEPRIKTAMFLAGGLLSVRSLPEIDLINFAPRVKIPVLMLNGRDDFSNPIESEQKPLFAALGTSSGQKQHVVVVGGHAPPRMDMMRHILDWLDTYLGPVSTRAQ